MNKADGTKPPKGEPDNATLAPANIRDGKAYPPNADTESAPGGLSAPQLVGADGIDRRLGDRSWPVLEDRLGR